MFKNNFFCREVCIFLTSPNILFCESELISLKLFFIASQEFFSILKFKAKQNLIALRILKGSCPILFKGYPIKRTVFFSRSFSPLLKSNIFCFFRLKYKAFMVKSLLWLSALALLINFIFG